MPAQNGVSSNSGQHIHIATAKLAALCFADILHHTFTKLAHWVIRQST